MYTSRSYPNAVSTGPYALGFKYLKKDYITASLVDPLGVLIPVPVTFTFAGTVSEDYPFGTTIVLDEVPNGRTLLITKNISLSVMELLWTKSASITKVNLHRMYLDLLDKIQLIADKQTNLEELALDVLEKIELILPENILTLIQEIQDLVLQAEAAADRAEAQAADLQRTVDLDFGSGKQYLETTVAVPDLEPGTYVRITQTGEGVGRPHDENAWDTIVANGVVLSPGQLTINAKSLDGAAHGIYRFVLTY